jgi:hypothetical protein
VICPHCGQPGHYVNGHYECPAVRGFVFDGCCGGEVAQVSEVGSFAYRLDRCMNEIDWDIATGRIRASFYDVRLGRIESGSIADGLRAAAADCVTVNAKCVCGGLPSNIMFCAICGESNLCESGGDLEDAKAA